MDAVGKRNQDQVGNREENSKADGDGEVHDVAEEVVKLNSLLWVFDQEEDRIERESQQVERGFRADEGTVLVVPLHDWEKFIHYVVVKPVLDFFILGKGATQNSDDEVEEQHEVDKDEDDLVELTDSVQHHHQVAILVLPFEDTHVPGADACLEEVDKHIIEVSEVRQLAES